MRTLTWVAQQLIEKTLTKWAVFETELVGIDGVKAEEPKPIVQETASSIADKATEGVKAAIQSKVAEAAEAAKVVLADTDGDGQEHNEL